MEYLLSSRAWIWSSFGKFSARSAKKRLVVGRHLLRKLLALERSLFTRRLSEILKLARSTIRVF